MWYGHLISILRGHSTNAGCAASGPQEGDDRRRGIQEDGGGPGAGVRARAAGRGTARAATPVVASHYIPGYTVLTMRRDDAGS
jgi:hypothetical protein